STRVRGVEHGTLRSRAMNGREVGYNVYLPPGYREGGQRYPVVHYLHGLGGNERDSAYTATFVDKAIRAKEVPPLIYVFPNGGYASMYEDRPRDGVMAETLIVKELIPQIDTSYRTLGTRDGRAVSGFSMGGFGALRFAFRYPELFSSVVTVAGGTPGTEDA